MEQKTKVIGKFTYQVTQMDAISALKVQTKLMKILGPGLMGLDLVELENLKGKNAKENLINKLTKIIPALATNFDDKIVNELVLSLFNPGGVFIKKADGPEVVDFETHFVGRLFDIWKVVAFILEVNFSMGELLESILPTTQKDELTQDNIT